MEEVPVVKEVIRNWNQENAEREGKMFLNLDWSAKVNDVQKIDVLIGIVGNWIEDTELVEACIKERKQVMLFFNSFQNPGNTIASEHDRVMAFREKIQKDCRCIVFSSTSELKRLLEESLKAAK